MPKNREIQPIKETCAKIGLALVKNNQEMPNVGTNVAQTVICLKTLRKLVKTKSKSAGCWDKCHSDRK